MIEDIVAAIVSTGFALTSSAVGIFEPVTTMRSVSATVAPISGNGVAVGDAANCDARAVCPRVLGA